MVFDPDADLARTLRQRLADEFRTEAEDAEQDARKLAMRTRTLAQVAHDAMTQGRRVACHVGLSVFSGRILHAGTDLAVVASEGSSEVVLVNLAGPIVLRAGNVEVPGRSPDPVMASSFLGALRSLEIAPSSVRLLVPWSVVIEGEIAAATADHVCLEAAESSSWHVPHAVIGAVQAIRPAT